MDASQKFSTSEGLLAYCLYVAGCQLANPAQVCYHIYTPEILAKIGLKGEKLWDGAQRAWQNKARGHVEYSFILTQRTQELIQAYREQRKELEDSDDKAADVIAKIAQHFAAGSILVDEMVLRIAAVNLVIRSSFMDAWKETVPLLKVPIQGKAEKFETTATAHTRDGGTKIVPAHGVRKPGYHLVSLNASPETLKKMGLA